MTEDEIQAVVSFLEVCLTPDKEFWGEAIRHARLFTPGTVVNGFSKRPVYSCRNAYKHSEASGLLYAEEFACHGFPRPRGWCVGTA